MTNIKIFKLIATLLLIGGLLSSCKGTTPDMPPLSSTITFRIVNMTPESVASDDLLFQIRNVKSGEYYELGEFRKGNDILLEVGRQMSSIPQPIVETPAPWRSHAEVFETDILVYRGDKLLGSIRSQMETTKYNYNHVTKLISYTGLQSVELFLPPHQKVDSDPFWYYTTFKIKF